jgi:hypothetical protein
MLSRLTAFLLRSRNIHNTCWPAFAALIATIPCFAQSSPSRSLRTGIPYDWSHHYVIFSKASSPQVMAAVQQDVRYWQQRVRMAPQKLAAPPPVFKKKKRVDWSVNLGGAGSTIAPGMYPAKYGFRVNAPPDCTNDFVVFALNVAGSGSQATIVGYNNLYTEPGGTGFCPGTGPTVKWAYNTGGAINTSPTLSTDGKKVAWVSNANPPVLHVLTIGTTGSNGAGVSSPAVAGVGNNAVDKAISYGSVGDTRSSPFVDYTHDVAYVAADDGKIYKFTSFFRGTPTQVTTGGWPFLILHGANHVITGPTFDSVSKNLYYEDDTGTFTYVREVGSTVGVCIGQPSPPCWGQSGYSITSGAHFLVEPPIVDSALQKVYVFVGNDNAGSVHAHVLQTDMQLSSFAPEPVVGQGGMDMFAGTFDRNYFTNPATGFLYACGYAASPAAASPVLYRIGFNAAGKMNATHDANSLALASSTVAGRCSPMTGFFNTTANKDWIFFSVANGCTASGGGTAGCVMSLDITSGFPVLGTGRPEAGGTSAIIVDNVSAQPQASSIYFTTQSTGTCGDGVSGGGCAVKLTQSGLN